MWVDVQSSRYSHYLLSFAAPYFKGLWAIAEAFVCAFFRVYRFESAFMQRIFNRILQLEEWVVDDFAQVCRTFSKRPKRISFNLAEVYGTHNITI